MSKKNLFHICIFDTQKALSDNTKVGGGAEGEGGHYRGDRVMVVVLFHLFYGVTGVTVPYSANKIRVRH